MPSEMVICYEINMKVNRDTHKPCKKCWDTKDLKKKKSFLFIYIFSQNMVLMKWSKIINFECRFSLSLKFLLYQNHWRSHPGTKLIKGYLNWPWGFCNPWMCAECWCRSRCGCRCAEEIPASPSVSQEIDSGGSIKTSLDSTDEWNPL